MVRSSRIRQALRNGFPTVSAQTVAHDLSGQFSKLLGVYIEPTSFCFNAAIGYWAHDHQDVQRIAGHFRVGNATYTFGSWNHTLSALARSGCYIIDTRGNRLADNMFEIEKGKKPAESDESEDWYSLAQLEAIADRAKAEGQS